MEQSKNKESELQGGSAENVSTNPGDDINSNLGSFGAKTNVVTEDPTLAALPPEEEKKDEKKKFKIDFEKFNRRKQTTSGNPLGVKMDIWLRNKKSFIIIWLIILGVIITILVTQITLPIYVNKAMHKSGNGPWSIPNMIPMHKAASILAWISIACIPAPFLFLLTTWIVGVNGVAKSRVFHYWLWFMLLLGVVCMLVSIALGGYILNDINNFRGGWS